MDNLKYILSCAGKFHHFEVAKILHKRNQLIKIICGYPYFKVKNENISKKFIETYGLYRILREPIMRYKLFKKIDLFFEIQNAKKIDMATSKCIENTDNVDVLLSLSSVGVKSGKKIKSKKKIYVCERSSSHIVYQNNLLKDEYKEFTKKKFEIDVRMIDRDLEEYHNSDIILVPSSFVKNSFTENYHKKIKILEFGADVSNFYKLKDFAKSKKYFNIVFIGAKSLRKGLHYLIDGFNMLNYSNKRLHIIGSDTTDKDFFDKKLRNDKIKVYGHCSFKKINEILNKCHLLVLPSVEDGFGLVVLQAAAAGCPAIVSQNTGAADFVNKNKSGIVIESRNARLIKENIQLLIEDKELLNNYANNSINASQNFTWSNYVDKLDSLILDFLKHKN